MIEQRRLRCRRCRRRRSRCGRLGARLARLAAAWRLRRAPVVGACAARLARRRRLGDRSAGRRSSGGSTITGRHRAIGDRAHRATGAGSARASGGCSRMIRSFSSAHFFSISSSSASRIIVSKPERNWRATPRALPTQWPTKRIALGRSLGPITTSATIATSSNSVRVEIEHLIYRHVRRRPAACRTRARRDQRSSRAGRARLRGSTAAGRRARLRLDAGGGFGRRWLVVLGHALLELFDALGDVAHHVREAAAAEQQDHDHADDQPVHQAETTHRNSPRFPALSSPLRRQFPPRPHRRASPSCFERQIDRIEQPGGLADRRSRAGRGGSPGRNG